MSTLITPERFRLQIDVDNWQLTLNNIVVPAAPVAVSIPNGSPLQFELFAFNSAIGAISDTSKIDYSNVLDIVIAFQASQDPHNAVTYWSVTVPKALINNTCTAANWAAGTDQQIKQVVSSTLNSFPTPTPTQNFWLCIYAITNGATKLWAALTAFQLGDIIIDTNGHAQQVTTSGTSGASAPSWATVLGNTTTDGGVTWTMVNVISQTIPFATFPVSLLDTGLPYILAVWPLPGPDKLLHNVQVTTDANGDFILGVDQNGYSGTAFAAPFMACPDLVYRQPVLVQSGNQIIITLQ